jgi:hypothetical protein
MNSSIHVVDCLTDFREFEKRDFGRKKVLVQELTIGVSVKV